MPRTKHIVAVFSRRRREQGGYIFLTSCRNIHSDVANSPDLFRRSLEICTRSARFQSKNRDEGSGVDIVLPLVTDDVTRANLLSARSVKTAFAIKRRIQGQNDFGTGNGKL